MTDKNKKSELTDRPLQSQEIQSLDFPTAVPLVIFYQIDSPDDVLLEYPPATRSLISFNSSLVNFPFVSTWTYVVQSAGPVFCY